MPLTVRRDTLLLYSVFDDLKLLCFTLLFRQKEQFEDVSLGSGNLTWVFCATC